jgi:TRAP-type C4-dicarboxylate transport system permease large subunit
MAPILLIVSMMLVLLILGCFMSGTAMTMICIPMFMPIVYALKFDPIWFALLFLLNIEIGQLTPPFGSILFVMKGVAPKGTTIMSIVNATLPYLYLNLLVMALIIIFPAIATWLPNHMLSVTE